MQRDTPFPIPLDKRKPQGRANLAEKQKADVQTSNGTKMTNSKYLDTDRPTTAEDWLKSLPAIFRQGDVYIQEYKDGKCSLMKLILGLKNLEDMVHQGLNLLVQDYEAYKKPPSMGGSDKSKLG